MSASGRIWGTRVSRPMNYVAREGLSFFLFRAHIPRPSAWFWRETSDQFRRHTNNSLDTGLPTENALLGENGANEGMYRWILIS